MAILTVTTRADEAFDGGETTASTDGQGLSLREAIALANSGDTITFDASLSGQTILLGDANGDGVVSGGEVATRLDASGEGITIDGDLNADSSPDITISGGGATQVLFVTGSDFHFTLSGVTIADGNGDGGAGLFAAGRYSITIENTVFANNHSSGTGGGAWIDLYVPDGEGTQADLRNVDFTDNSAAEYGGGLFLGGYEDTDITGAVFSGNEADWGGGLYSLSEQAVVTVSDAIFDSNTAMLGGSGGAISADGTSVVVEGVLFTQNVADVDGGAISTRDTNLTVVNSTFYQNITHQTTGGAIKFSGSSVADTVTFTFTLLNSVVVENHSGGQIGGIHVSTYSSKADERYIFNNIFYGNTADNPTELNNGRIDYGGNLFDSQPVFDSEEAGIVYISNNYLGQSATLYSDYDSYGENLSGRYGASPITDPMLGALQDNGGLVPTIALLPGSPLIDAGTATLPDGVMLPLIDALGAARIVGVAVDMGAVEFVPAAEDDPAEEDEVSTVPSEGDDAIQLSILDREVFGGAGHDRIDGSPVSEAIFGNLDNDTLTGGAGEDSLFGGQGDDYIEGNTGFDLLFGNRGNDQLYGGKDNDVLYGNQSEDTLFGGVADDVLFGGQGNDALYGEDGNDQLLGNKGDDTLIAGNGDDILTGGAGNDMFVGLGGADVYIIRAMEGDDVIVDYLREQGDVIAGGVFSAASQVGVIETGLVLTSADGSTLTLLGVTDPDDVLFL